MKKTLFIAAALTALFTAKSHAQVSDVSVTVSPLAGYTWWDNSSAVEDGMSYGARLGFGFGQNVELRAVYQKSVDLKSTVEGLTNDKDIIDNFKSRDVEVTRWGGEFKGNVPTNGWLAPYVVLGTGVQTLKVNDIKEEQIYADFGLGTKFNLSDRVVLTLEGRGSAFNLNPASALRTESGSQSGIDLSEVSEDAMLNWSALAGVQFYLGGRNPEEMTELDYAYNRKFSGGLKEFKFIVEPTVSYIKFDDETNFKDTYLLGANVGFDFTDFVGIRGYYMQATKNEEISTKWDRLAMYGGDFIARLNVDRGVVPYLTVGGGYMNVYNGYKGADGTTGEDSGYFAKGGVGLNVPLGDYIEVFGSANMLLTTTSKTDEVTKIQSPEELRKNVMYNAGLRLKLGAKEEVKKPYVGYVATPVEIDRIEELNHNVKDAYCHGSLEETLALMRERERLAEKYGHRESIVRMSPEELESLVNEVLNGVDEDYKSTKGNTTEERIDRLERLLLEVNSDKKEVKEVKEQETSNDELNKEILNELRKLNTQMRVNNATQSQPSTVVVGGLDGEKKTETTVVEVPEYTHAEKKSALNYAGTSIFGGVNFGKATVGLLGVKAHYNFNNSNVQFVPDVMIGMGEETAYAINANVHFPISIEKGFIAEPYVGTGLSLNNFAGDFKFGPNIIIGTALNVLDGKLYIDYTSRNLFDNNQIAVGYKFGF